MAVQRGQYHHHHRPRGRHPLFYPATALTIAVVAYVVVPPLTWLVDSLAGYTPRRGPLPSRPQWLGSPAPGLGEVTWDALVDLGLLALVVIVWMAIVPRAPGRRPPRR